MMALPFVAVGFLMKTVAALFILVAIALILIILLQKGRGGGLSAAFGGGGGAGGILGSKTGDFLTWVTIVLVAIFLTLAVIMARYYKPTSQFVNKTAAPTGQMEQTDIPAPETEPPMASTDDATDTTAAESTAVEQNEP
jgi:preprotein translocase subunit SecG